MSSIERDMITRLLLRWGFNSFGLWLASVLIPDIDLLGSVGSLLFAGALLSIINAVIKPIVTIFALPAILLSLGLFTIFVNGLMVYLASQFVSGFQIDSYAGAVLAGIIISLLNYWLTTYLEERIFSTDHE